MTKAAARLRAGGRSRLPQARRVVDAYGYAERMHGGQRTADGDPYIAHLTRVGLLVAKDGGSTDEVAAALLHDAAEVAEDVDRRLHEIRIRFGAEVARIVEQCTDTQRRPRPPWRARKEEYLEHIHESSPAALRVSIADKLDNVRLALRGVSDTREEFWERAGKSREEAPWYYRGLASLFLLVAPGRLATAFERAVRELERIAGDSPKPRRKATPRATRPDAGPRKPPEADGLTSGSVIRSGSRRRTGGLGTSDVTSKPGPLARRS